MASVLEEPELRLAAVAGRVREKKDSAVYQDWVRIWGVEEANRLWEGSFTGSESRIAS